MTKKGTPFTLRGTVHGRAAKKLSYTLTVHARAAKRLSHSVSLLLVPRPLDHLKALRSKNDREALFQTVIVGCSFVEGLGMKWLRQELTRKGVKFDWRSGHPHLQMGQILKLLNATGLLSDRDFRTFLSCAENRNRLVHRMYAKWEKGLPELGKMADEVIECVELISKQLGH